MAFRNIFISSPASVSLKNNQLIIKTQEEYSFPLEDISTILFESTQLNLTSAVLSRCTEEGILVYLCDKKHIPCGVITSYNSHSRKLKVFKSQIELTEPFKKQLWKNIIVQKIQNQAEVLKILKLEGYEEIYNLSKKVKSGDSDNIEAVAASKYFKYLFGHGFHRQLEILENARLNYGYAIIRGLVSRYLVGYGLEPFLGLHHKSEVNQFNLADDFMEPLRPIVDLCVYLMEESDTDKLSIKDKQILYNLLNYDILIKNQKHTLSHRVEISTQTLQASYLQKENLLDLCKVIPLQLHGYE